MFKTVSPVGFSSTTSNSKAKASYAEQREPQVPNSPSLSPSAGDTIDLKANALTVTLAHTIPLSHTPHFGGEKEDKALWDAAGDPNKLEAAKAAIEAGADVNAQFNEPGVGNPYISPIVNRCVEANNTELLTLILQNGAFPNPMVRFVHSASGGRPLHTAINNKFSKAVKILLDFGADPDATDSNTYRPLHLAARVGNTHPEITQYILDAGADTYGKTQHGYMPEHEATSNSILEMLSKARKKKREAIESSLKRMPS